MNKTILVIHIVLLLVGCFFLIASAALALLYFVEQRKLKSKKPNQKIILPLGDADHYASQLVYIGFGILTLSMLIGIYLAHSSWTQAWYLNLKFVLSMVVWFWYLGVLFLKHYRGLKGRKFLFAMVSGLVLIVWVFMAALWGHA